MVRLGPRAKQKTNGLVKYAQEFCPDCLFSSEILKLIHDILCTFNSSKLETDTVLMLGVV